MGRVGSSSTTIPLMGWVLLVVMILNSAARVLGSDPDLTTDFGINVTSGNDLKFTGLTGIPDSSKGDMNIYFATVTQFPAVDGLGISGALLKFGPNSLNSIHSHPRANEMFFQLAGSVDLGLVDTSNRLFTTTLHPGDVFVFPKGMMHFQINRSLKEPATAIAAFNSESGGRLSFPPAIFNSNPRIDNDVLEKAFNLDTKTVEFLKNINFPSS